MTAEKQKIKLTGEPDKDLLVTDQPSYCLYGKQNIKNVVLGKLEKELEELDKAEKSGQYGNLSDDEICMIIGIDDNCIDEEIPF